MKFYSILNKLLKEDKSMVQLVSDYVKWCDNYNKELSNKYPLKSKEFKENALYVDMDTAMKKYSKNDSDIYGKLKEFYSK